MLIRMGLNYGLHAAAGVATASLLVLAAEGWRRSCKAGNGPSIARGRNHDAPDPDVAPHNWIDEEAAGAAASGSSGRGAGSA